MAHAALALACALGAPLVLVFHDGDAPATLTAAAFGAMAVLLAALALHHRRLGPEGAAIRVPVYLVIAALSTAPAYYYGPNSWWDAVVVLAVALAGVLSPRAIVAWTIYVAGATGLAGTFALVAFGVLPDHSLMPAFVDGIPPWKLVVAHGAMHVICLGTFVGARVLRRRFDALAERARGNARAAARREALLSEARAEYQSALVRGAHGLLSGHTVGGYLLGRLVGRGRTGEVYEAVSAAEGARAAVEVLRGDHLRDPAVLAQLLAEAARMRSVAHPHVATVFDVGGAEASYPHVARELVSGATLAELVTPGQGMALPDLRLLVTHVAAAVSAVHAAELVHRDISPTSLVRTGDGGWKLVDLGLAHATAAGAAPTAGTLSYMAPELVAGRAADGRADVYALAAVAYTAVTGASPISAGTTMALAVAVADSMPVDPRVWAAVPADVADVLRIGLAKAPGDRFDTPVAFRDAFIAASDDELSDALREHAMSLPPWSAAPEAPANTTATSTLGLDLPTIPLRTADSTGPTTVRIAPQDTATTRVAVADPCPLPRAATPTPATTVPAELTTGADVPALMGATQRDRTRSTNLSTIALVCAFAPLLAVLGEDPVGTAALLASFAGLALLSLVLYAMDRRGVPVLAHNWPKAVRGLFAVGIAYYFGFNSGAGVVYVTFLFLAGIGPNVSGRWYDWPYGSAVMVLLSQGAFVALIAAGAIDDHAFVRLVPEGSGVVAPLLQHAALQCVFWAAIIANVNMDRRYQALLADADAATVEAERQGLLLATARAELRRLLTQDDGGIFTGHRIGPFELGRLIGRGGMGEVYEATDQRDGAIVALKLMRGDRLGNNRSVRMFLREAATLQRVDSPNVARVLHVADADEALPYIAMELLEGRDLGAILRERERLSLPELRAMIADVCAGLHAVHEAGVVHCDIKPQNAILTRGADGARWKLVDFGIAKLTSAVDDASAGVLIGTPAYMAPEQAADGAVDVRADLYSLGLVCYRALVGRVPYRGGRRSVHSPPDPRLFVDMSLELELVLRIALAHDPDDRFQSARELADAFEAAFERALPPELRRRGRELLRRHPWSDPAIRAA